MSISSGRRKFILLDSMQKRQESERQIAVQLSRQNLIIRLDTPAALRQRVRELTASFPLPY
jgi:hypothetical protein